MTTLLKAAGSTLAALALASLIQVPAQAQDEAANYPSDTVVIQVPFTAGGSTDVIGRLLAELLGAELGGTFIVENLTGAAGAIGTEQVARSRPDGSALLIATPGPLVMLPLTEENLPYELWRDFRPVTLLWSQPVTLLVRKDRFATVDDYIEAAKARPGEITFGSAGIQSLNHIAGEFFANVAEVELLHIPYQGIAPAITDTLAGNIDSTFVTAASLASAAEELHGLVVASEERLPFAPDVPTGAEVGLDRYVFSSYGALLVPAATPDAIVDKLNQAIVDIFADPVNRDRLEALGVSLDLQPGDELKQFVVDQTEITRAALGL